MTIDLTPLVEALTKGNCVPFLGLDGGLGVPGVRELAERLAAEAGLSGPAPSLSDAAQEFELKHGRRMLVDRLRGWYTATGVQPGPVHHLLAQLPFAFYFTTAPHDLLERALQTANRPFVKVVSQEDTAYIDPARAAVFKLMGDFEAPNSLVVTKKDHARQVGRTYLLADVVRAALATHTLLFLNYDLGDPALEALCFQITAAQGRHRRSAYAVWPNPDESRCQYWGEENVQFIDAASEAALTALHRELARRHATVVSEAQPTGQPALPERPFRFLDSYRAEDAALFAGRDQEILLLSQKIRAHRLVVLTGASGTGKTSLLQAGVLPRLAGEGWRSITVRPGGDPQAALGQSLALADGPAASSDLRTLVAAAEAASNERLIVVLDQFEEVFQRLGPQALAGFAAQLSPCLTDPDLDTRFVVSLREDFFPRLSAFQAQVPEIFHNAFVLNRLTREQALAAIVEPLRRLDIGLDDGLAEQIAKDLDKNGIDPPQLQIVCDRLYDEMLARGERSILLADYRRLGGVEGLLPKYLGDVLSRLPEARPILEALVGEGGLRTMQTVAELRDLVKEQVADLPAVLEQLVAARLVRSAPDGGAPAYELVHDVLAASIWSWFGEEAKEAARARGVLERARADWAASGALLDPQRLDFVAARWPFLGAVDAGAQTLLLRSAVREGHDVGQWLERCIAAADRRQVLLDLSDHGDPVVRARAYTLLIQVAEASREDDPAIVRLERAATDETAPAAQRTATLALHQLRGAAAVTFLQTRVAEAEGAGRAGSLRGLAILSDAGVRVGRRLGPRLQAQVTLRVAALRLARHWPRWGWRVAGATAGGAAGLALAFGLLDFLTGRGALAFYEASFGLPFGAVAGLLCGLGLALAAALANGDRAISRLIGGGVGGALGVALGLQLWQAAFGAGSALAVWPAGLLAGALLGAAAGASVALEWPGFLIVAPAAAGGLGFGAAELAGGLPAGWSVPLSLLAGTVFAGLIGMGLMWADSRAGRFSLDRGGDT